MPDSLEWIADAWNSRGLYITCARGLSPQDLVQRMADHEPVEVKPATTLQEASGMVDMSQVYCTGRIGQAGDWAFIVENGGSEGWALDPGVSRGAEVLIFDPRPDDPPSFFSYHANGEVQLYFELGGYDPAGAQPELLRPALEADGVIPPEDCLDDMLGMDEELSSHEQRRRVLTVIGEHFGLFLSQQTIVSGHLPVVITRTSPPTSW
ncbi:hypothetical protein DEJ48_39240 [Streptomyces venezuelae]|uniref:Uncharacterized protein n=1 Tax=Streptomyces venezuelae TaxID=54571 RepID=A0A5P2C7J3_STRVZ|nr:DUF6461 domain-containing protein [Streptomyces venezuelae]QES38632.1 hypothetical protein DEJ48_39240 [Streptomyces venezuelae]